MMHKCYRSSCISALSNSDPPSDRKRAIRWLMLAFIVPAVEVLATEALLNSVYAINASVADLICLNKIHVM